MTAICTLGVSFQSTPPARGATILPRNAWYVKRISIHAPREGGDLYLPVACDISVISIHAPREGGDFNSHRLTSSVCISIHAPREGGDILLV